MDVRHFEDQPTGWRVVGQKLGCETVGADLIAEYRQAHMSTLSPREMVGLQWHEGQLRAAMGDYAHAILLLEPQTKSAFEADRIYAEATVAFLKRDRSALVDARDRLAKVPKPDGFEIGAARFKEKFGREIIWPTNLDIVDGLIACFESPYMEAYGGGCRGARRQ